MRSVGYLRYEKEKSNKSLHQTKPLVTHLAGPGPRQASLQVKPTLDSKRLAKKLQCRYNDVMADLKVDWDPRKAASNEKKHGVTFEETATAFSDENGRLIPDPDHSEEEERFILLGMSWSLRVLVVCHCFREATDTIRIISARKANKAERSQYGVK